MTSSNDDNSKVKNGWIGRFFEDFRIGDVYPHPVGRTITEEDNLLITFMALNTARMHYDEEFARGTEFGKILVMGYVTVACVMGLSSSDLSMNSLRDLKWEKMEMLAPIAIGDTVYAKSEVLDLKDSENSELGIVKVATTGFKPDGTVVTKFIRVFEVYRRKFSPIWKMGIKDQ